MPIVVTNASGEEILSIGGDPYSAFKVDKLTGNTSVSAIPGAMANENFVVAAGSTTQGSVLKYSSNGTTWQEVNFASGTNFDQGSRVAYDGNTTWVATGSANPGYGTAVYSSDSLNWTNVTPLQLMNPLVTGVCFAPDRRWYAVGYDYDGRNTIIRSGENDPEHWTNPENSTTYMLNASSAYFGVYSPGDPAVGADIASDGKNTLVAVGYASPTNSAILWADTKIDGTMWYNATLDDGVTYVPSAGGVAYNGFLWVSAGVNGIMASTDGKTWKIVATPYMFGGQTVSWNGQYWIVGGTSAVIETPAVFTSYDGFTWEPGTIPGGVVVQAICWNGTYWIAGGQNFGSYVTYSPDAPSASFITSTDAVTWTGTTGLSGASFDVQVNGIANRIRLPNAAPPGAAVTTTGSGAPALTLGNPGDFYYDKTTFGLYGPKTKTETLGSNGSMFFTSNYGTVTTDPSSDFLLTGDFTIQFWMNAFSNQGSIFSIPTGTGNPGETGIFVLGIIENGDLLFALDASTDIITNSVSPYQWSYYSMVRSSTSGLVIYSNGSNIYSNAGYATNTFGNLSGGLNIGVGFYGNITNFQWVNGYAAGTTGFVWTRQTGSGQRFWELVASSADGTKLVAVPSYGYIYTSADSGVTWTERTGSGQHNWYSVASSADGTKLIAGSSDSLYIYTSTDSGVTWTERTSAGRRIWRSIASSADGTKLVAGIFADYIYTSADSGVTWTGRTGSGQRNWYSVASSADGTKLVAVDVGNYIYTSSDSGVTWTQGTGTRQSDWYSVASSADGTKLVAGAYNNQSIYTSADSGATWTEQTGAGFGYWTSVASSADGTKLVASAGGNVNNNYIYTSADSGVTWTEQTSAGQRNWRSIASSADGTKLVAGSGTSSTNEYIYTAIETSVVPTAPLTALSGASLLLLAAVDLSATTTQPTPVFIDSTGNHTMTTTGNVMWSGDNPFQTTTLSWGSATFPPKQRATPNTYTGNGPPVIHPAGSQAGDIYYDISGGGRIKYILT